MRHETPNGLNIGRCLSRHIIIKLSKVRWNFQGCKGKIIIYIQENPLKIISRLLSRNLAGKKIVGLYIQIAERRCRSEMKEKKRFSQKNKSWESSSPLDIYYKKCWKHSLRWNKRIITNNMKTWRYKTHCKCKDLVKIRRL